MRWMTRERASARQRWAAMAVTCCGVLWALPATAVVDSGFDPTQSLGDFVAEEGTTHIQLSDSGVLHYDTFTVPVGATVKFHKNPDNTGVSILTGGDVLIEGTVSVAGTTTAWNTSGIDHFFAIGREGGPGGSDSGGLSVGGGRQSGLGYTATDTWPRSLDMGASGHASGGGLIERGWISLTGGSGGGYNGATHIASWYPGSGGGLLTISSPSSIIVDGSIDARGASTNGNHAGGGGGLVRLVADTIAGDGIIRVNAGGASTSNDAHHGLVRLEAFFYEGQLTQNLVPASNVTAPILSTPNPPLPYPEHQRPRLEIASVNAASPTNTVGSWPANVQLVTGVPIDVVIEAEYMPVGVEGLVVRLNPMGSPVVDITDAVLEGTFESSSATVSITLADGLRLGHIEAFWTAPMPITNL